LAALAVVAFAQQAALVQPAFAEAAELVCPAANGLAAAIAALIAPVLQTARIAFFAVVEDWKPLAAV